MVTVGNTALQWRTAVATCGRSVQRLTRADHRAAMSAVRRGIRLPELPTRRRVRGQVWAVSMVRDELDVLPTVLDHLEEQGVDRVLIADNGSVDGTREELERRAAEGRVFLARDEEPAYHQAAKMTLLARAAWRAGADWVVPFDADELWFADEGRLADRLRHMDGDVVTARLLNAFPTRAGGWGVDPIPHWHGKVAFRSHPLAWISQGNHEVDRPGIRLDPADAELRIAHLPWRSFAQFCRKVRQGSAAYEGASGGAHLGGHWKALGAESEEGLRRRWDAMLDGQSAEDMHWTPHGPLVAVDPLTWTTWDPDNVLRTDELQR